MATKVKQICVLVLWISCQVLTVKGRLFSHLRPLTPVLCPSHAAEENVCYDMVKTNFTCSTVIENTCNNERKRTQLIKIEFSSGPCYHHVKRTCQNYICQARCCDGYHRDIYGKCTSEADANIWCMNGGTPVGDKCKCTQHYEGKFCQNAVCGKKCQNGGECEKMNRHSLPTCVCPSNFTGEFCENVLCEKGCENGGQCVQKMTEGVCLCKEGYTGRRCEIEIGSMKCEKCRLHNQYNTNYASDCSTNDDCAEEEYCCEYQNRNICVYRHEYFHQWCYLGNLSRVNVGATYQKHNGELCRCTPIANKNFYLGRWSCDNKQCLDRKELNCLNENEYDEQSANQTLPPNYHKPIIENCPREGEMVVAYVASNSNVGTLSYRFKAFDWGGQKLSVTIHKERFYACNCNSSTIFHNKATTHPDKYGKTSSCCFTVKLIDETPPKFLSCPSPVYALDTERIYWRKPEAVDNVGVRRMVLIPEVSNGSLLNAGSYIFQYKAEDWSGNTAICKFYLNIIGRDTDEDNYPEGLQKRMKKVDTSVIVGGCVVGILAILLMVLIAVIFRVCRTRTKRLRALREQASRIRTARQRNQNEDPVFTVFSSDPPPYDVAVKDKLPEYTPRDDPPEYEQCGPNQNQDNMI